MPCTSTLWSRKSAATEPGSPKSVEGTCTEWQSDCARNRPSIPSGSSGVRLTVMTINRAAEFSHSALVPCGIGAQKLDPNPVLAERLTVRPPIRVNSIHDGWCSSACQSDRNELAVLSMKTN